MDRSHSDDFADAGPRVLVADDSPAAALLVRRVLERAGCSVDVVSDGAAAVDAVLGRRYDFIVLDVEMPGLDGIAAAEAIRSDEHRTGRGRVPIVVLSAADGPDLAARCQAMGIERCLPKSAASIRALCEEFALRGARATAGADPDTQRREVDELLPAYLLEANQRALCLPGLLETEDFAGIERIAHQFHGSGAAYGVTELSTLGSALESAAHARDRARTAELCARIGLLVSTLLRT